MHSNDASNLNAQWSIVPLKYAPQAVVEISVGPSNFPNGMIVRIPETTHDQLVQTNLLHLRHILDSSNITPDKVSKWIINGHEEDSMSGWNPAFEQVIPKTKTGSSTEFHVYFTAINSTSNANPAFPSAPYGSQTAQPPVYQNPHQQFVPQPVPTQNHQQLIPQPVAQPNNAGDTQSFDYAKGIESDWIAVLQMEKQMVGLRSQLITTQTSLNSLNKDLSGKEAQQADQLDKKNWQDARRWMRDSATKISVSVRDHDIGPTSGAGQRDWFEQMYESICVNKQPVPNMKDVHREFGKFRSLVKTLFNSMSSVKSAAERDGIQRANRVLNTIRAKKRDPRRSK